MAELSLTQAEEDEQHPKVVLWASQCAVASLIVAYVHHMQKHAQREAGEGREGQTGRQTARQTDIPES